VGSTVGARLISSSRAGDELLSGYTTSSSPWLYDEQGASRAGHERVLGDRSNKRDASGRVLANFLSALVPNMERILYFMKSLRSAPFQSNMLKVERSRSFSPNAT
jgi:hypothetical protein